ncbi:hypothetical protein AGLY_010572, partial [Aphis glycines]
MLPDCLEVNLELQFLYYLECLVLEQYYFVFNSPTLSSLLITFSTVSFFIALTINFSELNKPESDEDFETVTTVLLSLVCISYKHHYKCLACNLLQLYGMLISLDIPLVHHHQSNKNIVFRISETKIFQKLLFSKTFLHCYLSDLKKPSVTLNQVINIFSIADIKYHYILYYYTILLQFISVKSIFYCQSPTYERTRGAATPGPNIIWGPGLCSYLIIKVALTRIRAERRTPRSWRAPRRSGARARSKVTVARPRTETKENLQRTYSDEEVVVQCPFTGTVAELGRRHRRDYRAQRSPAMVARTVVAGRSVQESRWTSVAFGMGMCPCTLAGRRGDSGIGELVLVGRQCYRRRGYYILIRLLGPRARGGVIPGGGRVDRSDRLGGRVSRRGGRSGDERA